MRRTLFVIAALSLLAGTGRALAQEKQRPPAMIPAATETDVNCAGFITPGGVQASLRVIDRPDNDLMGASRVSSEGEFLYLNGDLQSVQVGSEWRLVRADTRFKLLETWNAGELGYQIQPALPWFPGQTRMIRDAGQPYTDVGKVRVIRVTPAGAVAKILSTCAGASADDLAVPYKARDIPSYDPTIGFDRFAPSDGKLEGSIIASKLTSPYVAEGEIAFLNLGSSNGVRPGQRFRIFHVRRELPLVGLTYPDTPRENIGEMVVLFVDEKSAAAKVISSVREISVGDGVELE